MPQVPIIKGDAKSVSIAAASIVAKVTRDRLMVEYDKVYAPSYGFAAAIKDMVPANILRHCKKYGTDTDPSNDLLSRSLFNDIRVV